MGSPYFVHSFRNRINVVRTHIGFERVFKTIIKSMDVRYHPRMGIVRIDEVSPEYRAACDILRAYVQASVNRERVVTFLESRYEWQGWEKFQRVLVIDFSGEEKGSWTSQISSWVSQMESDEPLIVHTEWHNAAWMDFPRLI